MSDFPTTPPADQLIASGGQTEDTLAAARRAAPVTLSCGLGRGMAERLAAVAPFQHRNVRVSYGSYAPARTVEGRVVGASYHLSNGNSTGDLILAPTYDGLFKIAGVEVPVVSIALARIVSIEAL